MNPIQSFLQRWSGYILAMIGLMVVMSLLVYVGPPYGLAWADFWARLNAWLWP